jgi:DNA-binding NarL/FixJ family response regulator
MDSIASQLSEKLSEPSNGKIKIVFADEHPIVCEGLSALLAKQPDMEILSSMQTGTEDSGPLDQQHPDIVLVDFAVPASLFKMVEKHPSAKIVVFTASQSEEHIYQAVHAGACGYLLKTAPLEQIIDCIRSVFRGQSWIPQTVGELLARRMASPQLTRRERDVLFAMSQGRSNKEIGLFLGVSEGTVKVHMTHILEKLKVSGRTEAIAAATSRGLISFTAQATSKPQYA